MFTSCRRGSLRLSGSGDSRTVSESGEMPLSHSLPFPHEHEGGSKPALSSMLSRARLSFRRPHKE